MSTPPTDPGPKPANAPRALFAQCAPGDDVVRFMPLLNLSDLTAGLPGISSPYGEALAQAGGVCLQSQGHRPGVRLWIQGYRVNSYSLDWPQITDQILRSFNDPEEATEFGAVALAVLIAKTEIGYSVIERSRKGTGFDYWMGDESEFPFDRKARLEISGIRKGGAAKVNARVNKKLKQISRSGDSPDGYVIVVEFGTPLAEVRKK